MKLRDLCLSTRTANCLSNAGITSVERLRNTSSARLIKLRHFGNSSLQEIFAALYTAGVPHVEDDMPNSRENIDKAIGGLHERIKWLEALKVKMDDMEAFRQEFKNKRDAMLDSIKAADPEDEDDSGDEAESDDDDDDE